MSEERYKMTNGNNFSRPFEKSLHISTFMSLKTHNGLFSGKIISKILKIIVSRKITKTGLFPIFLPFPVQSKLLRVEYEPFYPKTT